MGAIMKMGAIMNIIMILFSDVAGAWKIVSVICHNLLDQKFCTHMIRKHGRPHVLGLMYVHADGYNYISMDIFVIA